MVVRQLFYYRNMWSPLILFPPLLLFIKSGGCLPPRCIPFRTFENHLAHGLTLQGCLRLDLTPQFRVDVSKDVKEQQMNK
jgi:hypothetical protein